MYHGIYNRLNLHVSASNISVIRATNERFHKTNRTGKLFADTRKHLYRIMLQEHKDARQLFVDMRF